MGRDPRRASLMNTPLQDLAGFSLAINNAIQTGDWANLSLVLAKRHACIKSLVSTPLSAEDERLLVSIQHTDQMFVEAIQSKKSDMLKELQAVTKKQKGLNAYYATAERI